MCCRQWSAVPASLSLCCECVRQGPCLGGGVPTQVCVFLSFQEYVRYVVVHTYVEVCVRVSLCLLFVCLFIFAVSEMRPRALCKLRNASTSELHAWPHMSVYC